MQGHGRRRDAPDREKEKPSWPSALAIWMWPLAGTLAIAMIVVMVMQSPELVGSLRNLTASGQDRRQAAASPAGTTAPDKTILTGESTEKPRVARPDRTGTPSQHDLARLRLDLSRLHDTLGRFEAVIKRQNKRIVQLEDMLGPITGSIAERPKPTSGRSRAVSKHTKSVISQKPQTATKSGQLTSRKTAPAMRVTNLARSRSPVAETVNRPPAVPARASSPPAAKPAAGRIRASAPAAARLPSRAATEPPITDTRVATLAPDRDGGDVSATRFAVRLARTPKRGELDEIWEKLLRGDADELTRLSPFVRRDHTAKKGELFSLLAGPIDDMAEALELCVRLKIKGIACEQTLFSGTPLGN